MSGAAGPVAAPPGLLTDGLRALLAGFAGCRGVLFIDARSAEGIGHTTVVLAPSAGALPGPLLSVLEDGWGCELSPATRELDQTPAVLVYAFALWRIPQDFGAATEWRRRPRAEAVDAAATALRGFAWAPTFVIDGRHTVAALWRLTDPLDVPRDRARALVLQRALAARLVADARAAEDLQTLVPLPGSIVRNVGTVAPIPLVQFAVVAPERRYAVTQLETACADAGVGGPRRKGVRL